MFSQPGKTLMDFARSLFLALVIFFIGFGLFLIVEQDLFYGLLCIIGGILGSFLTCLLLSAIGQAVESLRIIAVSTHVMAGEPLKDELPVNTTDPIV